MLSTKFLLNTISTQIQAVTKSSDAFQSLIIKKIHITKFNILFQINYIDRKDMLSAIVPNLRKRPVSCLGAISNSECKQTSAILTVHMSWS